jgi:A118 family predicted phage portal protein
MAKIEQLQELFRSKGFNPIVGDIYKQQEKWLNWYRGEVNDFHYYTVKNVDGGQMGIEKKSLNMAKKVSEDWASLLFNEETKMLTNDNTANKRLNEVFDRNYVYDELPNFIEFIMGAYGTGVIVEYTADGYTEIDFIYGNRIISLSSTNTTINEIAVINEFKKNKQYYTHITYHTFRDDIYRVQHEVYEAPQKTYLGKPTSLSVVFSDEEIESLAHVVEDEYGNQHIEYYKEYESKKPFFQVFKPGIANNFDTSSPFGVTVTANAISALEMIDNEADNFDNEGETARRKIFVSDDVVKTQKVAEQTPDGASYKLVKYFDKNQKIYQTMKLPKDDPMKEFSPIYNSDPYIQGLKFKINLLSSKVGLGTGYYSFDTQKGMTATEVISKNSDTWKNRKKHIRRLERVLVDMMYAVLRLEQEVNAYSGNLDLEYKVMFDDSIIEDDAKMLQDMKADVDSGIVPPYMYLMKKYKLDITEAKRWVKEAEGDLDFSALEGIEAADRDDT